MAGFDFEFLARGAVDDLDMDAGLANAIAQFGGQIPLQFFAAELFDAGQQGANGEFGAAIGKEDAFLAYLVFRIAFAHLHLVSAAVFAGGREEEFFANGPKAEEADSELALHALSAISFELAFDGIADVSSDVLEIWKPFFVARNALTVVFDAKEVASFFAPARDGNVAGGRVDAVLDEFGDGFEGILLRKGDDIDRIPIISDSQAARILHVRCMVTKQGEETTKYSKHTKYDLSYFEVLLLQEDQYNSGDQPIAENPENGFFEGDIAESG